MALLLIGMALLLIGMALLLLWFAVVPVVPAKLEQSAKASPPTANWLTGRLAALKRGGQRGGWPRGGGLGAFVRGGYRGGRRGRRF